MRRLLPFVARPGARVFQWLMGIEAWTPSALAGLLARAPVFLAISQHTWERFVAANPAAAACAHEVVHLGTGGPLAGPAPEHQPGLVLMCGRLAGPERRKGFDETIAAWPQVVGALPGARLAIVGEGPDRVRLERLARERGVVASVQFLGPLPEADKQAWMARCQVLALPSRLEGFGLVYVEAMRHGRPCLVGDADAAREVARPGLESEAVDASSPASIAAGLLRLLRDDALYRRLADNALRRAADYLTEAHFSERLRAARARHVRG
jgi:phosphatidylinositol alpha-1,6-mannosyltransferase